MKSFGRLAFGESKFMSMYKYIVGSLVCAPAVMFVSLAFAHDFNIPSGQLKAALDAYIKQSGVTIMYSAEAVRDAHTRGAKGDLTYDDALTRILTGSGFTEYRNAKGAIGIIRAMSTSDEAGWLKDAAATAPTASGASLETVTVTSSKIGGDVQNIPISITAMSQEQLTATQTTGGPDLVKQIPNLTFSKTNFTGYNIEIRGIGTQAISVTTDPAVAVAFNDTPFIRNHFFEQEFYDVSQVEVLRGPQGTLYGRNATAGVVNLVSAKPTDQYEAMASVDVGNYETRRLEGMLNIPIVGDKLDLRLAGEWTKRDGYSYDEETGQPVDGRDLWSGRVSLLAHPVENLTANFVWEHFQEDDDRERSTKQLCTRDIGPSVINGPAGPQTPDVFDANYLAQGCAPGPLYGSAAFQTPSAGALPFVTALELFGEYIPGGLNPYAGLNQSQNLRVVDSLLSPKYRAKNDTFELNADYNITQALTFTSQTGFNKDMLYSTEDYNRFNTAPGLFQVGDGIGPGLVGTQDGEYCDPQLGCSSRLVGEDLSQERAQQFSQELRVASNFNDAFNFSAGVNYLHYQTVEDYYVFINALSLFSQFNSGIYGGTFGPDAPHDPFNPVLANSCNPQPADPTSLNSLGRGCTYIDPNPLGQINGQGHNYFRSENPYRLNSWAGFGEVYYQVTPDVKMTGGLRWTDDRKHFVEIPSWAALAGEGYPVEGVLNQEWKEWTGRFNTAWTPKLDFTDVTMLYGSYSRGYKGGGANPPGTIPLFDYLGLPTTSLSNSTHPLTFKPEFVDAFELGTKNTLLDGTMTFNADIFYYKYQNYQVSQIVDRTSVNLNFNADVKGAELESTWEPIPGLRFNFSGGYESTRLANGSQAIDLMDRTAGHSDWLVIKPYPAATSNCILPTAVVNEVMAMQPGLLFYDGCYNAYSHDVDPVTYATYKPDPATNLFGTPVPGYAGFNPATAPNGGQGFDKNLSGNQLPNAPPFTLSAGAQYSMPVSADWAATARVDGYWQGNTFARVFNDKPYDQIHGYTNVNFSLVFTNQDGWQVMAYMKNVFDTTAITGAFLNTDDTGLTTNIFVTDPRLFGLRITKNW
jgi:iron complex outermembrane receptor protein